MNRSAPHPNPARGRSGDAALFHNAAALCAPYPISYYDAGIIAAARQLGCVVIYLEDLADGRSYGGIGVENPF